MNHTEIYIERKLELEASIKKLESKLASMPKETLVCYKHKIGDKKYPQFYKQVMKNGHPQRQYLSHKNIAEAKLLARKLYYSQQIADMKNELSCINYYIKNRVVTDPSALLSLGSPYRKLLVNNDPVPANWEYLPYNKSTDHPEHLTVPAPKGEFVRSKSESNIAQILYSHGIPYRYEEIHDIYGYPMATDFTVMNPKTGQIILWEHFGRCDDPGYQSTVDFKMYRYIRDGYLPGVNFITTYEDNKHPLDFVLVEEIIKKFFL
ncbi:hypothetical protein [Butyrivibrio sp. NC2007]|uniref:hypothetical protein n=1 Tax=Butyrivibrio sp. NC2007 TaxID=1280683 RepID=UPI0003B4E64E|nr:hypothetical protein [Butyrivibrio sp. NC2007]